MAARLVSVLTALALGAACLTPVAEISRPWGDEPTATLWVIDHGWHTAIVVRRADVDRALWPEVEDFPTAALVEIAWGDREFYMATPASAWLAIKAAFGTSKSVLHVVGLSAPIATQFPRSETVELRVSRRGFEALTRFVSEEYARDAERRPVRLQHGLYGASWFYAARSRYSLSHTCNTWIARALHAAGLPVSPSGVITAGGVMEQVRAVRAHRAPTISLTVARSS